MRYNIFSSLKIVQESENQKSPYIKDRYFIKNSGYILGFMLFYNKLEGFATLLGFQP